MAGPNQSAPKRSAPHKSKHARADKRDDARDDKERVVGLSAAKAALRVRPRDVLHIAYAPEARHELAEFLREAARLRIAYREVDGEELAKIAGTLHHEGICLQVKARRPVQLPDLIKALDKGGFIVALDRAQNPHNVGALLRSAAYFGAAGLLVGSTEHSALTPAAVRIAEGGAEYVPVCFVTELSGALAKLSAAGAQVVGADAHEGEPLDQAQLSNKSVLVLGSERSGMSNGVHKRCNKLVRIAGSGHIESLNVSVAAGIFMAHAAKFCVRASTPASTQQQRSP